MQFNPQAVLAYSPALVFGSTSPAASGSSGGNTFASIERKNSSGRFALNLPTAAMADLAFTVGNEHGGPDGVGDKFERHGIAHFEGQSDGLPLLSGCAAWLACRLIPEPHVQQAYDRFLGEVTAAWADARVYSGGRWHFEQHPGLRTLHHVAGGHFLLPSDAVQARSLE